MAMKFGHWNKVV